MPPNGEAVCDVLPKAPGWLPKAAVLAAPKAGAVVAPNAGVLLAPNAVPNPDPNVAGCRCRGNTNKSQLMSRRICSAQQGTGHTTAHRTCEAAPKAEVPPPNAPKPAGLAALACKSEGTQEVFKSCPDYTPLMAVLTGNQERAPTPNPVPPKAGLAVAPKAEALAAPKAGAGEAPKAGAAAAPKAGAGEAPNAGAAACAPKAGCCRHTRTQITHTTFLLQL